MKQQRSISTSGRWAAAMLALLAGLALAGCHDPLFAQGEARSQYDAYDAVRDQRAPAYFEDPYGRQRPNLRGRLSERE